MKHKVDWSYFDEYGKVEHWPKTFDTLSEAFNFVKKKQPECTTIYLDGELIEAVKEYKVLFINSERGWGVEKWTQSYDTEEEALRVVKKTNDRFCSSKQTPDYYIKAEYVGTE